jgi:hypothetical protein
MATDHDYSHANHTGNPDVAYERRDLGARGVLLFFAILLIAGVIVHFIVWGVYGAMERVVQKMEPPPNPIKPYEETPRAVLLQNTPMVNMDKFPQPRLQADDATDMQVFNYQEDQILNNAWTDQQGTVHLPIGVAMQVIAKRGLPSQRPGAPPASIAYQLRTDADMTRSVQEQSSQVKSKADVNPKQ